MPTIPQPGARAVKAGFFSLALVGLGVGFMSLQADRPTVVQPQEIRLLGASVFQPGEKLKYRVHYGFLNAGEAWLVVDNRVRTQAERPCYQIEVQGRSVGAFDKLTRIRDVWGTFLDTAQMRPHRAYRDIRENKYHLEEDLRFDYARRVVNVKRNQKDTSYRIPSPVYDIVAGYYFFRQVDYSRMSEGTIMMIDAFFDNEQYKFKMRYLGKETIKSKYGKVRTIVLSPIMPENSFFDGENSLRVWLSDDASRIPIRVSAELFVGSVDLDLTDYQGTRGPVLPVKN